MRLRERYERFRHWAHRYDSPLAFGRFCVVSAVLAYIAPSLGFSWWTSFMMALCAIAFAFFSAATAIYIAKKKPATVVL